MPTATERTATERERGVFTDNLIPERVFNAEMRRVDSTLSGIAKTLERIEGRFDKIDERFEKIDERFGKIDERFDKMDSKIDSHFYWVIGTMLVFAGLFSSIVFAIFKGQ